jgi:hypothetical protein
MILTPIFSESGFQVFPERSNPLLLRLVVVRTKLGVGAKAETDAKARARVAAESFIVMVV